MLPLLLLLSTSRANATNPRSPDASAPNRTSGDTQAQDEAGRSGSRPTAAPPAPPAPPPPDVEQARVSAKTAFEAGERAFAQGDFAAALSQFKTAFELAPHGAVRFNVAVCLERLGRLDESYREYQLAERSPDLDAAAQQRARAEAERLLRSNALLTIAPESAAARLLLDGEPCAQPCTRLVAPGTHRVQLLGDPKGASVLVRAGERVIFRLAPSSRPAEQSVAPRPHSRRAPGGHSTRTSNRAEAPSALSWVGGAVALAGLSGFTYFGLRTQDLHDEYQTRPSIETRDDGISARNAANAFLGLALVGGAAIALDFIVHPSGRSETVP